MTQDSRQDPTLCKAKLKRLGSRLERADDAVADARRELRAALDVVEDEAIAGLGGMEADVAGALEILNVVGTLIGHAEGYRTGVAKLLDPAPPETP